MLDCWRAMLFSLLLMNLLFLPEIWWFHETIDIFDFFITSGVYQILDLVKMQFFFLVVAKVSENGISILRTYVDFCWQKASHEDQNWISSYRFSLWVNHQSVYLIQFVRPQDDELLHLAHNFTVHFDWHVEDLPDWKIDFTLYHWIWLFGRYMSNLLLFEYFFSQFSFQRWKNYPQKFTIWNLINIFGSELVPEKRLSIGFEDQEVLGCRAQIIWFQKLLQTYWAHDSVQSQGFIWLIFEHTLIFWKWFKIRHFTKNFSSGLNFLLLVNDHLEDSGYMLWYLHIFWRYFVWNFSTLWCWFLRFVGSALTLVIMCGYCSKRAVVDEFCQSLILQKLLYFLILWIGIKIECGCFRIGYVLSFKHFGRASDTIVEVWILLPARNHCWLLDAVIVRGLGSRSLEGRWPCRTLLKYAFNTSGNSSPSRKCRSAQRLSCALIRRPWLRIGVPHHKAIAGSSTYPPPRTTHHFLLGRLFRRLDARPTQLGALCTLQQLRNRNLLGLFLHVFYLFWNKIKLKTKIKIQLK